MRYAKKRRVDTRVNNDLAHDLAHAIARHMTWRSAGEGLLVAALERDVVGNPQQTAVTRIGLDGEPAVLRAGVAFRRGATFSSKW